MTMHRYEAHATIVPGACELGVGGHLMQLVTLTLTDAGAVTMVTVGAKRHAEKMVAIGVAVLIALVGVGNTLSLSVLERTHELGLLRAIGMDRSGIRSMVRWEAAIIATFVATLPECAPMKRPMR